MHIHYSTVFQNCHLISRESDNFCALPRGRGFFRGQMGNLNSFGYEKRGRAYYFRFLFQKNATASKETNVRNLGVGNAVPGVPYGCLS